MTQRNSAVRLGIGDDCAILRIAPGDEVLVTTDFSLEGVHFRRDWQSPECIGHRCLTRGLSDIAAMGGRPVAAFLSLALPANCPAKWVDRFFRGLLKLASRHGVDLAGGDTAQSSDGVLADIAIVGTAPKGTALRRSGARPGDSIYVTGALGESAAALRQLSTQKSKRRDIFPEPRIAVGQWLREREIASAAIDISDGLSTDLSHICEESGLGAVIEAAAIPIHPAARRFGKQALELALHGGEDYELLFTASGRTAVPQAIAGVTISKIGHLVKRKTMTLVTNGQPRALKAEGWEHFRAR